MNKWNTFHADHRRHQRGKQVTVMREPDERDPQVAKPSGHWSLWRASSKEEIRSPVALDALRLQVDMPAAFGLPD
jgi:hypothetical protein